MSKGRQGWNGDTLSPENGVLGAGDDPPASAPPTRTNSPPGPDEAPVEEHEPAPEVIGGRYRVLARLGSGGYGVVFRAVDERLEKAVAVKLLSRRASQDGRAVQRFKNEALSAGRLEHPNVVGVTDFALLPDGRPYLVMELVEGETLSARLKRSGRLDVAEAVRIATDVCGALERVHRLGIVHRDLKPGNIMLRPPDDHARDDPPQVKILDFGIAKLLERPGDDSTITQAGQVVGTPVYMAPEQARAALAVDHRADLYAVGVMLYEMVTGQLPFRGRHALDALVAKLVEKPAHVREVAPEVSPELGDLIARAVAREPERRFESAAAMATALRPFLTDAPERPLPAVKLAARRARTRILLATVGLVVVAVPVFVWVHGMQGQNRRPSLVVPSTPSAAPAARRAGTEAPAGTIEAAAATPAAAPATAARTPAAAGNRIGKPPAKRPAAGAPALSAPATAIGAAERGPLSPTFDPENPYR